MGYSGTQGGTASASVTTTRRRSEQSASVVRNMAVIWNGTETLYSQCRRAFPLAEFKGRRELPPHYRSFLISRPVCIWQVQPCPTLISTPRTWTPVSISDPSSHPKPTLCLCSQCCSRLIRWNIFINGYESRRRREPAYICVHPAAPVCCRPTTIPLSNKPRLLHLDPTSSLLTTTHSFWLQLL